MKRFSKRNYKVLLVLIFIFTMGIYSYNWITAGFEDSHQTKTCVILESWFELMKVASLLDIIFSIILPFSLIFIASVLIIYRLARYRRISHNRNTNNRESTTNFILNNINETSLQSCVFNETPSQIKRKRHLTTKTTKAYLLVAVSFIILHMPIVICKIRYIYKLIKETLYPKHIEMELESDHLEELIERITSYIYYLNFSFNFFLHVFDFSNIKRKIIFYIRELQMKHSGQNKNNESATNLTRI
jgi:hypothetical protein